MHVIPKSFETKKQIPNIYSSPGEQAPMNPNNPNPNGIPIEPTKGCDFINPQRFLAYVLCIFMLKSYHMNITFKSYHYSLCFKIVVYASFLFEFLNLLDF